MTDDGVPIRRVLAPNPSPLTGTGTNTYIIGQGAVAVIDPGPALPSHLDAILASLGPAERVSHILVTHAHRDHSALAPALAARTGAEVLAFGAATEGRSAIMERLAPLLPGGGEGLDPDFLPDRRLGKGELVDGEGWSLRALHTPGHLGGHLCFALGETLFSGDHVMGWSTTLISPPDGDMGDYVAALVGLRSMAFRRFLPGHGDAVTDPINRLEALIRHRQEREAQIRNALRQGPLDLDRLTRQVYHDIPPPMLPAATRNALAHLIDMQSRNQITAEDFPGPAAIFHLTDS
ncbi:MAG: MBL fold metallo-hydrolase [Tabrizicola sp.]|nr:MBL fold metallo-hydrolase [Tabrizicola sp.]